MQVPLYRALVGAKTKSNVGETVDSPGLGRSQGGGYNSRTYVINGGGSLRRAKAGDVILLVGERSQKQFVRMLKPGETLHTHSGYLLHDELIGQPYGTRVQTHLGTSYYLLVPTTEELVRFLRRESQIIFPKDAGYIIMKLGIRPGSQVLEAGTGSGGLCLTLATIVGDGGHVYSYDVRDDLQSIARQNLAHVGLDGRVTFRVRDAAEGFDEADLDAVFLDMLTPWAVLDQARAALSGGSMLGCLVPTVNQLVRMLDRLEAHPGFDFAEAEELILRPYRTLPQRIRPEDRIVGHTGYLIFARAVVPPSDAGTGLELSPAQDGTDREGENEEG